MKKEHQLVCSYLLIKYYISTAYRSTNIGGTEMWYYETLVWDWDNEAKKTKGVIDQYDSGISESQALTNHFYIVQKYLNNGNPL